LNVRDAGHVRPKKWKERVERVRVHPFLDLASYYGDFQYLTELTSVKETVDPDASHSRILGAFERARFARRD